MSDEAARMREMAARAAEIEGETRGYVGARTALEIAAAIRALPLPPASDKTAEALRLAREALEDCVALIEEAFPDHLEGCEFWETETLCRECEGAGCIEDKRKRALAALSALTRPEGGE